MGKIKYLLRQLLPEKNKYLISSLSNPQEVTLVCRSADGCVAYLPKTNGVIKVAQITDKEDNIPIIKEAFINFYLTKKKCRNNAIWCESFATFKDAGYLVKECEVLDLTAKTYKCQLGKVVKEVKKQIDQEKEPYLITEMIPGWNLSLLANLKLNDKDDSFVFAALMHMFSAHVCAWVSHGFTHNDLHTDNVRYDTNTRAFRALDFGRSLVRIHVDDTTLTKFISRYYKTKSTPVDLQDNINYEIFETRIDTGNFTIFGTYWTDAAGLMLFLMTCRDDTERWERWSNYISVKVFPYLQFDTNKRVIILDSTLTYDHVKHLFEGKTRPIETMWHMIFIWLWAILYSGILADRLKYQAITMDNKNKRPGMYEIAIDDNVLNGEDTFYQAGQFLGTHDAKWQYLMKDLIDNKLHLMSRFSTWCITDYKISGGNYNNISSVGKTSMGAYQSKDINRVAKKPLSKTSLKNKDKDKDENKEGDFQLISSDNMKKGNDASLTNKMLVDIRKRGEILRRRQINEAANDPKLAAILKTVDKWNNKPGGIWHQMDRHKNNA